MKNPSAHSTSRILILCSALALAGCGGGLANSWVNPGNWFGQSRGEALGAEGSTNPLIPSRSILVRQQSEYAGQPVAQIKSLRVERKPGGAIIHVVGIEDSIGYYDVRLEADNEGEPLKGVLSYTLKAVRSTNAIRGGGEAARQINAAVYVSDQNLSGAKTIVVKGARNQRSTRRR